MHCFRIELCKAYKLAKSQIEEEYPIKVTLNDLTYEIDENSLQNVTDAIKSTCTLYDDKIDYPN